MDPGCDFVPARRPFAFLWDRRHEGKRSGKAGDRRRLKVSERGYGVMKVGDRVLAIRYNDGNYGFYDWFDIVKCKE